MNKMPKWAEFIQANYKAVISNAFILTGNIGDYYSGRIYLKDYLVKEFLTNSDMRMDEIYFYDINSGGNSLIKGGMKNGTWENMIEKLTDNSVTSKGEKVRNAVVIFYPQYLIPAGDYLQEEDKKRIVSLHNALTSWSFITSNNLVIFVADSISSINPIFMGNSAKTMVYNIELPDVNERYTFILDLYRNLRDSVIRKNITDQEFANLTAGLQLIAIEDILLIARRTRYIDSKMVMLRKQEVIKKEFGEIIEIFDTNGFSLKDFAGQENIKAYFKEVVIDAIQENEVDIIPKGVLLMGPPGTGKTYFARCIAGDAGINFIEFKLSKILGKYVGESEKAMEKALSVFRALAPVGVFMDEIDQSVNRSRGGSDGASSVNANIFGMLLSEMSKSENRGRILWLAATNYPNHVDEALKRAGRFDKKIPFFAPTLEERKAVFYLHLKKMDIDLSSDIDIDVLSEATEGYTQAEIETIIVKALELTKRAKRKQMCQDKLELALKYMLSAQNDKVKEMEDIALRECNDQEFIPVKYLERHKKLMSTSSGFGEVSRMNSDR